MSWKWVGENLSLGGLIKNAGYYAGKTAKNTLSLIGDGAEFVSGSLGTDVGKSINSALKTSGKACDSVLTTATDYVGCGVNKTIEGVGYVAGEVAAAGVELIGAEKETVQNARKVGNLAGAFGAGMLVGTGIANAAVTLAAAAGTSGAAATASGLAALGGGPVSSGGAGIAGGQIVTQAITAATTTSAAVTVAGKENK